MNVLPLNVVGLNKSFGGVHVTRNVNLQLAAGSRHALIGPNGAGKTTLLNLLTGLLSPASGKIYVFGTEVNRMAPERRVKLGLARTFQINSLFLNMTVAENVGLAVSAAAGFDAKPWGRLQCKPEILDRISELLTKVRLVDVAHYRIRDLAYGYRRLVEIAVALALNPKILMLDEPAAGVPARDTELILQILEELPSDLAVLLIEHDMNMVFRFASRITVLVDGAVLTEGSVNSIRSDERVHQVYLGKRSHG